MVLFIGPLYSGKHEAAKAYAEAAGKQFEDLKVCEDAAALTDASEAAQYDIILCTEVGSGLVPVDGEERKAREAAGRLSIRLAEQADEVYRVVCGIAKKLK
ncbi:MAG: bifunctional adenosylcobinamide kinase/adenosylcobinamide-phosphate guanylyltransferase [Clostridia bacterium]|nr:bifunctional adenosylcobinamide kinase/adenosylcobinamide-phosphate guanylyltransferase [Clostridia bacterium]